MGMIDRLAPHAHWLLRLAIASVFVVHGFTKFPIAQAMADMLGVPTLLGLAIAVIEVSSAVLIIVGGMLPGRAGDLLTRLAGLLFVPVLVAAIARFHWGRWDFTPSQSHPIGGMEFQITLILIGLFFAIRGNESGQPQGAAMSSG